MSLSASVWLVIVFAVLGANLPFLNDRWLGVVPRKTPKTLGVRLLEMLLVYLLIGGVALFLEHSSGQIYPQRWEFYATTFTLFVTWAFPGCVFRRLHLL